MQRLLKDYNYYLKMERAMSENTVASYCSDIEKFLEYYGGPAELISTEDVEGFIAFSSKLSKRSQARALSSLKSFCGWLLAEGIISGNPCDKVDAPKLGTYLPDVLSIEEVDAIIDAAAVSSWLGKRDRALVELLYGCGLRVTTRQARNLWRNMQSISILPFMQRCLNAMLPLV